MANGGGFATGLAQGLQGLIPILLHLMERRAKDEREAKQLREERRRFEKLFGLKEAESKRAADQWEKQFGLQQAQATEATEHRGFQRMMAELGFESEEEERLAQRGFREEQLAISRRGAGAEEGRLDLAKEEAEKARQAREARRKMDAHVAAAAVISDQLRPVTQQLMALEERASLYDDPTTIPKDLRDSITRLRKIQAKKMEELDKQATALQIEGVAQVLGNLPGRGAAPGTRKPAAGGAGGAGLAGASAAEAAAPARRPSGIEHLTVPIGEFFRFAGGGPGAEELAGRGSMSVESLLKEAERLRGQGKQKELRGVLEVLGGHRAMALSQGNPAVPLDIPAAIEDLIQAERHGTPLEWLFPAPQLFGGPSLGIERFIGRR